ncbi:alpha/beta fold hydrolase [Chitinophaga barathri]|uniref:Alpha/beta hydrolase n=1 Tax=Chitinophaga barathri TaxID=1647451 RepID=A0A3N4MLG9_9BACT|nr:alpha/beta hydrolase [Chitinophaga barathri]RPD40429.1 alpha/beta hydrolase [Chitinophaga barathri]
MIPGQLVLNSPILLKSKVDISLTYQNSEFSGIVTGSGSELLICFHGFGESGSHFGAMEAALGNIFTIVALDMPFHGKTVWNEGRVFEKSDLTALVEKILEKFGKQTFSLMGYSMGGRLALCIVEEMAARIIHLVMAAPDGLRNNPWHMFATQTTIGNRIFLYNTHHPGLFFRLLTLWRRWGLLNESVYKFAFYSMDKVEKRQLVYNVWTVMRKLMPSRRRCKRLMARYNIDTILIFGRYDRVIPPAFGERFADGAFPCKMLVLDKGHQLISEELGFIIRKNIRS